MTRRAASRHRCPSRAVRVPRPCPFSGKKALTPILAAWLLLGLRPASADPDIPLTRNEFGGVGLIDMPSARMAPDGDLSVGASFFKNTQHYNFGFQALPWLETNFRYTGLNHFDPSFPVYYDRSFAAKARLWEEEEFIPSIAVGINDLVGTGIYSGEYLVASKQFGALDATMGIGWGRLGSTALFRNPLSLLTHSFTQRPGGFGTPGGTRFDTFFRGPAGLFGGLTWATPLDGLSLIAEYSSDRYVIESQRRTFIPKDQYNLGAAYQLADTVTVGLDWLYGRSIEAHFSFDLDPTTDPYPNKVGPALPPAPPARTQEEQVTALNRLAGRQQMVSTVTRQLSTNSMMVDALWRSGDDISDVAVQGHTLSLSLARGDLATACKTKAQMVGRYDGQIETVAVSDGRQTMRCPVTMSYDAAPVRDPGATVLGVMAAPAALLTIDARTETGPDKGAATARIRADATKQLLPIEAISLNGAEALIYYSNTHYFSEKDALDRLVRVVMADAPPDIEKIRFIAVQGGVPQREFDVLRAPAERDFAQVGQLDFADAVDSMPAPMQNPVLGLAQRGTYPRFSWQLFPQVRQQLFDPSNPVGVQLLAGAGATVELLPGLSLSGEAEASIWDNFNVGRAPMSVLPHVRTDFLRYFTEGKDGIGALEGAYRFRLAPSVFASLKAGYLESMFAGAGGEILWRPEGQRWALGGDLYDVQKRDFNRLFGLQSYRVVTGHIAIYYASPWYGLNFALRAGQYLAGDRGATFEMTRRFASGVEIGGFFTKTNVSAARFGEGSFDKGIMIRIPLGWVAPINSQNALNLDLRPVQRDGGQRLSGDATLYEETRRTSEGEMGLP